jgi:ribonuclease HI
VGRPKVIHFQAIADKIRIKNLFEQLWNWLGTLFEHHFDCTTLSSVFQSCKNSWSMHVHHIALAAITHVFHTIWMARNGIRFNNARISLHAAQMKVLTAIAMSATLVDGFTDITEHSILNRLRIKPRLRYAPVISLVMWKPPSLSWMKVNTDGSVTNLPPSAACGGNFRDHLTTFKGCFAMKLAAVSVLHAELMAIIMAIEIVHRKGWSNLWIKSDSQAALCAFANPAVVPWDLWNRWKNCMLLGLNLVSSHIFREGNSCVDSLANYGHSITDFTWWNSLPQFLRRAFINDNLLTLTRRHQ